MANKQQDETLNLLQEEQNTAPVLESEPQKPEDAPRKKRTRGKSGAANTATEAATKETETVGKKKKSAKKSSAAKKRTSISAASPADTDAAAQEPLAEKLTGEETELTENTVKQGEADTPSAAEESAAVEAAPAACVQMNEPETVADLAQESKETTAVDLVQDLPDLADFPDLPDFSDLLELPDFPQDESTQQEADVAPVTTELTVEDAPEHELSAMPENITEMPSMDFSDESPGLDPLQMMTDAVADVDEQQDPAEETQMAQDDFVTPVEEQAVSAAPAPAVTTTVTATVTATEMEPKKSFFARVRSWFSADDDDTDDTDKEQAAVPAMAHMPAPSDETPAEDFSADLPTEISADLAADAAADSEGGSSNSETADSTADSVTLMPEMPEIPMEQKIAEGEAELSDAAQTDEAVQASDTEETAEEAEPVGTEDAAEAVEVSQPSDATDEVADAHEAPESAEPMKELDAPETSEATENDELSKESDVLETGDATENPETAEISEAPATLDTTEANDDARIGEEAQEDQKNQEIEASKDDHEPLTASEPETFSFSMIDEADADASASEVLAVEESMQPTQSTEQTPAKKGFFGAIGEMLRNAFGPQDETPEENVEVKSDALQDTVAVAEETERAAQQQSDADESAQGEEASQGEPAQAEKTTETETMATTTDESATDDAFAQDAIPVLSEKISETETAEVSESAQTPEAMDDTAQAEDTQASPAESAGEEAKPSAQELAKERRKKKKEKKKASRAAAQTEHGDSGKTDEQAADLLAIGTATQADDEEKETDSLTQVPEEFGREADTDAEVSAETLPESLHGAEESDAATEPDETPEIEAETQKDGEDKATIEGSVFGFGKPISYDNAASLSAEETDSGDETHVADAKEAKAQDESFAEVIPRRRITVFKVFVSFTAVATFMMALFVVLLFLMSDNTLLKPKNEVDLPNFYGKKTSDIVGNETFAGFSIEFEDVYTGEEEKGTVVDQRPKAPRKVKENAKIILRVSAGVQTVEVPDVKGIDRDEAKKMVRDSGLNVLFKPIEDENVSADDVVETEPKAGTVLNAGETITLYISRGALDNSNAKVPNCIGMTSTSAAADLLLSRGLTMGTVRKVASSQPVGTIIDQSPAAGGIQPRGTVVTITVSGAVASGGGGGGGGAASPATGVAQDGHQHTFSVQAIPATDGAPGFTLHTCTICGFYTLGNIG